MFTKKQTPNRALAGKLSDVSLAELIGFFCSQRKTGRLKIGYPRMPGVFYINDGSLVDAKVGALNGKDAIFYALAVSPDALNSSGNKELVHHVMYEAGIDPHLPAIPFEFNPNVVSNRHTIYEPWTNVIMIGMERLENGVLPEDPFAGEDRFDPNYFELFSETVSLEEPSYEEDDNAETFNGFIGDLDDSDDDTRENVKRSNLFGHMFSNEKRFPWVKIAAVLMVCALGFGAWKVFLSEDKKLVVPESIASAKPVETAMPEPTASSSDNSAASPETGNIATDTAKTETPVEKPQIKKKVVKEAPQEEIVEEISEVSEPEAIEIQPSKAAGGTPSSEILFIKVKLTYDEEGRVLEAKVLNPSDATSVHEASALRMARMKRLPIGKPGTMTMNIPISSIGNNPEGNQ